MLDQENTYKNHMPHGMAQAYQAARPSNASAGPRSGSFLANLQYVSPLQAGNPLPPQYPQPHVDLGAAHAPPTDLFRGQLESSPFGSTLEWNDLGTTGLAVQGPKGLWLTSSALLITFNADSGLEYLQGTSPQAFRHGHGLNAANASIVPERFPGDNHHPVDFSSSHSSFDNSARHSSSPGAISSTKDVLQEPLGPKSIQFVNAQRAAMAQDLGQIIESSQRKGDFTGGYHQTSDENFYLNQASQPVPQNESSMPMSDLLLGEGYGHRDLQVVFQEPHPEHVPEGPAPQEAGARKRSQTPRSVAGLPTDSKRRRGKRLGPLTPARKAHANRVRKAPRKGCIHRRRKQSVILRRCQFSVAPQTC